MARSENGSDKDFVLSSDYQSQGAIESQEDTYYGSDSGASGGHAFKHIYIAIGGFLILIVLSVVLISNPGSSNWRVVWGHWKAMAPYPKPAAREASLSC